MILYLNWEYHLTQGWKQARHYGYNIQKQKRELSVASRIKAINKLITQGIVRVI